MEAKKINDLNIKIFADGADISQIKKFNSNSLIKGFTTNPTLMRKQGISNYEDFSREILTFVKEKPVSFEIFADDEETIISQARYIASWGHNVYVKIPVTNTKGEFLGKAINTLSKENIKLNVTAVFTSEQVNNILDAINSSAPNVISIFSGRIADAGVNPIKHFKNCINNISINSNIEFLWASPRELYNLFDAEDAGADIITISQDLINKIPNIGKDLSLYSKETVEMFYNDAKAAGYQLNNN